MRNSTNSLWNSYYNDDLNGMAQAIEDGADVNSKDDDGRTLLHITSQYYHNLDKVELLLKAGAKWYISDYSDCNLFDSLLSGIKFNGDCKSPNRMEMNRNMINAMHQLLRNDNINQYTFSYKQRTR